MSLILFVILVLVFYYEPYIDFENTNMHITAILWYNRFINGEKKERRYKILFEI